MSTAVELGLGLGPDVPVSARVTLDNWQEGPFNRWAFSRVSHIVPSARISRGEGDVSRFEVERRDISHVVAPRSDGSTWTIAEMIAGTYTDAIVVLRQGRIVFEHYLNGMTPGSVHLLQSVSKSITGVLAGILVGQGRVDPAALVTVYVPEAAAGGYSGATVQHLLDMQAAVQFSEIYDDPASEVQMQDRVGGWRSLRPGDPPGLHPFLVNLKSTGPHGQIFQYCSATTDLLGWVMERATGRRLWELLGDELWSKLGAEHDAQITVDRCDAPFPNGGISVTVRDLARFGQMMLQNGSFNGQQIVPAGWVHDSRSGGSNDAFRRSASGVGETFPNGSYRNCWWVTGDDHGVYYGSGIFGQHLHIDPTARVVIAKVSSHPEALDLVRYADTRAAFRAIAEAVRED